VYLAVVLVAAVAVHELFMKNKNIQVSAIPSTLLPAS
jgi:hypothetical protein